MQGGLSHEGLRTGGSGRCGRGRHSRCSRGLRGGRRERLRRGNQTKIGVLLPDSTTARWETNDRPLLDRRIKELCDECTVEHANAKGDVAIQQAQMDSMLAEGVDAILLAAVDARSLGPTVAKADEAGIPVIAYDRLAEGPISGYASFDGEEVGRLQGTALLKAMGDRETGDQIVMMNGDPSDPNAVSFKAGALSVLKGRVEIAKAYDTPQWRTEVAHMNMSGAISALGADNIDGVYAANDGLAGRQHRRSESQQGRPAAPRHRAGRRARSRAAHCRRRAVHDRLQALRARGFHAAPHWPWPRPVVKASTGSPRKR